MARFLLRRLLMLIVALLVSSFVIFSALYIAPGNPIAVLSGGRTLPPAAVKVLEHRYHLERAVPHALLGVAQGRVARRPGRLDHPATRTSQR